MKFLISLLVLIISLSSMINSQNSGDIYESAYRFRINGGQCGETVVEFSPYGGCQLGCPIGVGYLNFRQTSNNSFVATRYTNSGCSAQPTTPLSFNFTCTKNNEIIDIPETDIQVNCYAPSLSMPDPVQEDSSTSSTIYVSFILLIIGFIASLL
ncbi:hypothetical protein DICPUDRAFT_80459 [Dictyostelium purpureum]|uniref:Uncharacterized protein n=1 Tax=Dictyostelium purpureum TaxID=5786 RepID=F0ZQJ4_DICPU|nr:uncharacterized protein DICPUDRAFT_80459 [Dictyostelium purpureum]EGC33763.1 hypothetical protein DICPUDRAFT_80459 [Dictyostelium purpureum]|eukprot:XP_003289688.1 hypothetical protein DICPUDRAFT_80459 [Dictyostelium purpureum]